MKKYLLNPFEKYSEKSLLLIGLLGACLGILFSFLFDVRFDGAIDMHLVNQLSLNQATIDLCINTLVISILLFVAGKIYNSKTRFIDILATTLVSRIPLYFVPLLNISNTIGQATEQLLTLIKDPLNMDFSSISSSDLTIITIFAIVGIAATIWSIALLYNGYKVASNAKKSRAIVHFVVALVLSEIITKVIFYQLK